MDKLIICHKDSQARFKTKQKRRRFRISVFSFIVGECYFTSQMSLGLISSSKVRQGFG